MGERAEEGFEKLLSRRLKHVSGDRGLSAAWRARPKAPIAGGSSWRAFARIRRGLLPRSPPWPVPALGCLSAGVSDALLAAACPQVCRRYSRVQSSIHPERHRTEVEMSPRINRLKRRFPAPMHPSHETRRAEVARLTRRSLFPVTPARLALRAPTISCGEGVRHSLVGSGQISSSLGRSGGGAGGDDGSAIGKRTTTTPLFPKVRPCASES